MEEVCRSLTSFSFCLLQAQITAAYSEKLEKATSCPGDSLVTTDKLLLQTPECVRIVTIETILLGIESKY